MHRPSLGDVPLKIVARTRQEMRAAVEGTYTASPERHIDVEVSLKHVPEKIVERKKEEMLTVIQRQESPERTIEKEESLQHVPEQIVAITADMVCGQDHPY